MTRLRVWLRNHGLNLFKDPTPKKHPQARYVDPARRHRPQNRYSWIESLSISAPIPIGYSTYDMAAPSSQPTDHLAQDLADPSARLSYHTPANYFTCPSVETIAEVEEYLDLPPTSLTNIAAQPSDPDNTLTRRPTRSKNFSRRFSRRLSTFSATSMNTVSSQDTKRMSQMSDVSMESRGRGWMGRRTSGSTSRRSSNRWSGMVRETLEVHSKSFTPMTVI